MITTMELLPVMKGEIKEGVGTPLHHFNLPLSPSFIRRGDSNVDPQ
jgi:hypothetical protein